MREDQITDTVLSYPSIREELLAYLKDCSEITHFQSRQEIFFDWHFFFDDHDFATSPSSMIGEVFYDIIEVEAVSTFVHKLEKAIGPGKRMPDPAKVDWSPVITTAKAAYQAIGKLNSIESIGAEPRIAKVSKSDEPNP